MYYKQCWIKEQSPCLDVEISTITLNRANLSLHKYNATSNKEYQFEIMFA